MLVLLCLGGYDLWLLCHLWVLFGWVLSVCLDEMGGCVLFLFWGFVYYCCLVITFVDAGDFGS